MEANFCKGSWSQEYFKDVQYHSGIIYDSQGNEIAHVFAGDWSSDNTEQEDIEIHEANGLLMAAAPELFSSLSQAVEILEDILEDPSVQDVNKYYDEDVGDFKFVLKKALVGHKQSGINESQQGE